ncbi:carboxypeptidase regulatory-like domain-containing protein [Myxococcus sp. AS-1-15]|uniref:carboxypeptidase regulatory-like domain-containing protein n=1 Tax=Myxococcus sp. AS-1-15 TaxID=2874600 RepID=UPI001CBA794E|nr:carboxypeptidase regulatory-like domain-containing protein [Myxococcus sp. AS-1-15]MBZ4399312.1 carboxypeptidase regulatory-like domain-containing protein [Myxococcus sp. AS-1-15]
MPRPRTGLSIRGIVVDISGRPIAGARVSASWPEEGETLSAFSCSAESLSRKRALSREPSHGQGFLGCSSASDDDLLDMLLARQGESPVHAETLSAEDGTFVLEGLPSGPQAVLAISEQGAALRTGVPAGSQGVELALESREKLSGQVVGDDDQPLEGVSVLMVSAQTTRFFDARTDARGRFEMGPLPDGKYHLLATKEGWRPRFISEFFPSPGLELRMYPPRTLTGRVVLQGVPVEGVEVIASPKDWRRDGGRSEARTDAEGRFAFELSADTYVLTAEQAGLAALARVSLDAESPPEVVLNLGDALYVEGTIVGEARGEPVVGARVKATPEQSPQQTLEITTGADGRYRLGPVEPGRWRFAIDAPGYIDSYNSDPSVELAHGMGPMNFALMDAISIAGRVVDKEGRPLAGAYLSLEDSPDYLLHMDWSTYTDSEGAFVLDVAAPHDFVLTARSDHFVTQHLKTRAPAKDLLVTMSTGGSVQGTLTDARGLPLAQYTVYLVPLEFSDPAQPLANEDTDPLGRFSHEAVAPGRYQLRAEALTPSADLATWTEVEVREGEVTKVELRLPEPRTLEGVVVDSSGTPLRGVFVRAEAPAGRGLNKMNLKWGCGVSIPEGVASDADGRFILRGLGLETYSLSATLAGHELRAERSTGVTAKDNEAHVGADATQVRLVMKRRTHVRGRLVGPEGAPIREFEVNRMPVTSPDGTFSLENHEHVKVAPFIFSVKGLPSVERGVLGGWDGPDVDLGEIRLETGRALRGVVLDAETGAPVKGVEVMLLSEWLEDDEYSRHSRMLAHSRSDKDGRFNLDHVPAGPLTLRLSVHDKVLTQAVQVDASQHEVTVRISPGG